MKRRTYRAFEDFCLNVPGEHEAYPELFRLLRELVPCDHAAFFRTDAEGALIGGFHEVRDHTPQATKFMALTSQSSTERQAHAALPTVHELFRMPEPIQELRFDTLQAQNSSLFRDVIAPIGGQHVLRVAVRDGHHNLGLLALVRNSRQRGFRATEGRELLCASRRFTRFLTARTETTSRVLTLRGHLLATEDGRVTAADTAGEQLWAELDDARFLPAWDRRVLLQRLLRPGCPQLELALGRGIYRLTPQELRPLEGQHSTYLIPIERWTSLRVHALTEMERFKLSSMEKQIALDLLRDHSQSELAQEHGIAVTTVITHIRSIYRKIGVRNRAELISALHVQS